MWGRRTWNLDWFYSSLLIFLFAWPQTSVLVTSALLILCRHRISNKLDGNAKSGCSGCLKEEPAFLGLFLNYPLLTELKLDLSEVKSRRM